MLLCDRMSVPRSTITIVGQGPGCTKMPRQSKEWWITARFALLCPHPIVAMLWPWHFSQRQKMQNVARCRVQEAEFRNVRLQVLPCPSFPCFFGIPCFFPCEDFLVFVSVFPFFSRDFKGSAGIGNPCFFGGFSLPFSKKTRKGRTG